AARHYARPEFLLRGRRTPRGRHDPTGGKSLPNESREPTQPSPNVTKERLREAHRGFCMPVTVRLRGRLCAHEWMFWAAPVHGRPDPLPGPRVEQSGLGE